MKGKVKSKQRDKEQKVSALQQLRMKYKKVEESTAGKSRENETMSKLSNFT